MSKRSGAEPRRATLSAQSRITRNLASEVVGADELPHEWLLRVARGEKQRVHRLVVRNDPNTGVELSRDWIEETWYPNMEQRLDAARAAAPYFAPKLALHVVAPNATAPDALKALFGELAAKLPV